MPESTQQMGERLCGVIAAARFEALSQPYGWQLVSQLSQLPTTALAAVRDGPAWYALTPVSPNARALIASWCFISPKVRMLQVSSHGSRDS